MTAAGNPDITSLLMAAKGGDASAEAQVVLAAYEYARRIADALLRSESNLITWQATALANEAYFSLAKIDVSTITDRLHLMRTAERILRNLLVERARRASTLKRGGHWRRVEVELAQGQAIDTDPESFNAIDAALAQLELFDPEAADVVRFRFVAGLSAVEVSRLMDVSVPAVNAWWTFARAWILRRVESGWSDRPQNPASAENTDGS